MGTFKIAYHKRVLSVDLPKISFSAQNLIKRAIEERLTTQPLTYGEPMVGNWKNHRRIRVSKYRVIYKIEDEYIVRIMAIGIRSKVYGD